MVQVPTFKERKHSTPSSLGTALDMVTIENKTTGARPALKASRNALSFTRIWLSFFSSVTH